MQASRNMKKELPDFAPSFLTTIVGSFPHMEARSLCERLAISVDIPGWPQLPRRTFRENMYAQFSASLPSLTLDEDAGKIIFDTHAEITEAVLPFYESFLADDLDAFALSPDYAAGFPAMLEVLREVPGEWAKGQVTGPISIGLTITDQDLRASLYNDQLVDVIVKNAAMNARWQVRELNSVRPNVIISVDEPYMASFGSAYISLSREKAISMLDEVFDAIHQEGALAGVHCCGNTDWSVLLATTVDILNLDAYGYLEHLSLYPDELSAFLDRGGLVNWGIVPNNDDVYTASPEGLAAQLRQGIKQILNKADLRGLDRMDKLSTQGLITTSCGLSPATVNISEQALELLIKTSECLQTQ
jgi:hypothetical protein